MIACGRLGTRSGELASHAGHVTCDGRWTSVKHFTVGSVFRCSTRGRAGSGCTLVVSEYKEQFYPARASPGGVTSRHPGPARVSEAGDLVPLISDLMGCYGVRCGLSRIETEFGGGPDRGRAKPTAAPFGSRRRSFQVSRPASFLPACAWKPGVLTPARSGNSIVS